MEVVSLLFCGVCVNGFDDIHPELKGFTAFFDRNIRPTLERDENRRKAAIGKMWMHIPLIVAVCAIVAFVLWSKIRSPIFIFAGVAFAGAGASGYSAHVLKDLRSDTKNLLISGVCEFIGWSFSENVGDPPQLETLIENGLLPRLYHRSSFEDKMSGNAHGADFEALECHLEKKVKTKNGHRWVTTFRGSIMALDFHRKFLGRTVVLRDKGFFNSKKMDDMKRVGLVDPVFEKIFEAYGTDQVEARYLLTPDFMQQLVDLETSVDGKNIRFAFINDLLLVVVETPNRFEAGSMMKPLMDNSRVEKILSEIAAVYRVVDGIFAKPHRKGRSDLA